MKKRQKSFTKFMSVLLCMLIIVSAVVVPVQAETSNDEWDNISAEDKNAVHTSGTSEVYDSHELDTTEIVSNGNCGKNGDNVKYELHKNGTLYIYGEGKIKDYSYYMYGSVINVVIEPGVTSIGHGTFECCSSLTSIEIPNSVTSIGDFAFYDCSSLTSIEIPNSVTSIGDSAFECCSSLTSIEIPNSVTSIGDLTFYYCSSLTSIEIPNSVTSIGDFAFCDCSSLTSIEIPNSVTSIGNYAFCYCSSLKDVYYTGTEEQWKKLTIGNDNEKLTSAAIHYNSTMPTQPMTDSDCITEFTLEYDRSYVDVEEGETFNLYGTLIINDNQGNQEAVEKILVDEINSIIWSVDDPDVAEVTSVKPTGLIEDFSKEGDAAYVRHTGTNKQTSTLEIIIGVTAYDSGSITITGTTSNDLESKCNIDVYITSKETHVTGTLKSVQEASGSTKAKIKIDNKVYDVTNKFDASNALDIFNNKDYKVVTAILKNGKVARVESVLDIVKPTVDYRLNTYALKYYKKSYDVNEVKCDIVLSAGAVSPFYDSDLKGTKAEDVKFSFEKYTVSLPSQLYFKNLLNKEQSLEKKVNATVSMKNLKIISGNTIYVDTNYIPPKVNNKFEINITAKSDKGNVENKAKLAVHNMDIDSPKIVQNYTTEQSALAKSEFSIDYSPLQNQGFTKEQLSQIDYSIKTWICTIMAAKSFAEQDFEKGEWEKFLEGALDLENFKYLCYDAIDEVYSNLGVECEPMNTIDSMISVGFQDVYANTEICVLNNKGKIASTIKVSTKIYSLNIMDAKNVGSYGEIEYKLLDPKSKKNDPKYLANGKGMYTYADAKALFPLIEEKVKDKVKDCISDAIDNIWDEILPSKRFFLKSQISNGIVEFFTTVVQNGIMTDDCIQYTLKNRYMLYPNRELYNKKVLYKNVDISCPVDVYVYDTDNKLCGSVINNEVNIEDDSIFMYCVDDKKHLTLLDSNYKIVLVGNDTGTMKYEISEYIGDELQRKIVYDEVPLESGKTYIASIPETICVPQQCYDLVVADKEEVMPVTSEDVVEPEIEESVLDNPDTDTDTDTDTPNPHDTDTDTDTPNPHDTDTDTDTPNPHDTDTDTDTPNPHDTDTDTDTPKPHDTDTDSENPKPHDTDTDTDTPKPHDTDTDTDTDKPIPPKSNKFGDIDGDGSITAADSLMILRRSVNLEKFMKEQEKLADVDGDGEITAADSLEVLRASVGLPANSKIGKLI